MKHDLPQAIRLEATFVLSNSGLDANRLDKHGVPTVTIGAGQYEIHTIKEDVHQGGRPPARICAGVPTGHRTGHALRVDATRTPPGHGPDTARTGRSAPAAARCATPCRDREPRHATSRLSADANPVPLPIFLFRRQSWQPSAAEGREWVSLHQGRSSAVGRPQCRTREGIFDAATSMSVAEGLKVAMVTA
ncbi:MAG: hypothetical protein ACXIUV_14115 [Alkalilacustris sp.]